MTLVFFVFNAGVIPDSKITKGSFLVDVKQTHAQTQAHRGRGDCANGDIAYSANTLRQYMAYNDFTINEKTIWYKQKSR